MLARVDIVIKALNEERHIERCLASAIKAVAPFGGQVILADSGSVDKTLEMAARYPVKVVQLANVKERCCGVGAQLGYQFVDADYVYVLDGDMEMEEHFLPLAVSQMEDCPTLGGIAGLVEELGGGNFEFETRKAANDGRVVGYQQSLDMGGLYRVAAIRQVGYLTNRNLHSYEEKELGFRLVAAGYTLERIAVPAIRHHGKTEQSLTLLRKRWVSRHLDGPGEWIRAVAGTPLFRTVALQFKQLWLVVAGWLAFASALMMVPWTAWPLVFVIVLHCSLLLRFWLKRGNIAMAGMSFLNIQISSAAMVRGLLRRQIAPAAYVDAIVVQDYR